MFPSEPFVQKCTSHFKCQAQGQIAGSDWHIVTGIFNDKSQLTSSCCFHMLKGIVSLKVLIRGVNLDRCFLKKVIYMTKNCILYISEGQTIMLL